MESTLRCLEALHIEVYNIKKEGKVVDTDKLLNILGLLLDLANKENKKE